MHSTMFKISGHPAICIRKLMAIYQQHHGAHGVPQPLSIYLQQRKCFPDKFYNYKITEPTAPSTLWKNKIK